MTVSLIGTIFEFGAAVGTFLISPIGLAAAGIALGVGLILLTLKNVFGIDLITPITSKFQEMGQWVMDWWNSFTTGINGEDLGKSIADGMVWAVGQIQTAWGDFSTWFQTLPFVAFAEKVGTGLINALNHRPTEVIPKAWAGAEDKIVGSISNIPKEAKIASDDLVQSFTTGSEDAAKNMANNLHSVGTFTIPKAERDRKALPTAPQTIAPQMMGPYLPPAQESKPKNWMDKTGDWLNKTTGRGPIPDTRPMMGPYPSLPKMGPEVPPIEVLVKQAQKNETAAKVDKNSRVGSVGAVAQVAPAARSEPWWKNPFDQEAPAPVENPSKRLDMDASLIRAINNLKAQGADSTTIKGFEAAQFTTKGQLQPQDVSNLEQGAGGQTFQAAISAENLISSAKENNKKQYDSGWIDSTVADTVKAVDQASGDIANAWNDRWDLMEKDGTGDVSALFTPGIEATEAGLSGMGTYIGDFAVKGGKALLKLDFKSLGEEWGIFSSGFKASAGSILSGLGSMGMSALAFGVYSILGMSPMLLIIGAVAIAAIVLATNFLHIRDIVMGVIDVVRGLWTVISSLVVGLVKVIEGIIDIFFGMGDAITGDFTRIKVGFGKVGESIVTIAEGTAKGAALVFGGMGKIVVGIFQAIGDVFKLVWEGIKLTWSGFTIVLTPAVDAVKWMAGELWKALTHPKEIVEKILALFDKVTEKAKAVGDAISTSAPVRLMKAVGLKATGQAGSLDEGRQQNDANLRAKGLEPEAKLTLGDRTGLFKQGLLKPFRNRKKEALNASSLPDMSAVPPEIMGPMLMAQMTMNPSEEPVATPTKAGLENRGASFKKRLLEPFRPRKKEVVAPEVSKAVESQVLQQVQKAPVPVPVEMPSVIAEQLKQVQLAAAESFEQSIKAQSKTIQDEIEVKAKSIAPDVSGIEKSASTARAAIAGAVKHEETGSHSPDKGGIDKAKGRINNALKETDSAVSKSFGSAKTSIDSLAMAANTFAPSLAGPILAFSAITDGVQALQASFTAAKGFVKNFAPALDEITAATQATAAAQSGAAAVVTAANAEMSASEAVLGVETSLVNAAQVEGSGVVAGTTLAEAAVVTAANAEMGLSEAVLGVETAVVNAEMGLGTMIASGLHTAGAAIMTAMNAVLAGGFGAVGAAAAAAWAIVTGPLLPIIIIIGVLVAVIGGLWLAFQNNFMGIGDIFDGIWEQIVDIGKGIWDTFGPVFEFIGTVLMIPIIIALKVIQALFWGLGVAVKIALLPFQAIGFAIGGIWDITVGLFGFLISIPSTIVNAIGSVFSGLFDAIGGFFNWLGEQIQQIPLIGPVLGAIGSWLGGGSTPDTTETPAYAGGGLVRAPGQGSSTSDGFLASLSDREYVVNAASTASNFSLLEAINSGMDVQSILDVMPIASAPLNLPTAPPSMGGGGEDDDSDIGSRPIQIHLEIHQLTVGQGGKEGAREFLEALDPYLDIAVRDALRRITELTR